MNPSVTGSALNQIPLVNSTQILTASAQAPINSVVASTPVISSTPIVASTPVMTSTPIMASTPVVGSAVQPLATPVLGASVPITPVASVVPQPVTPVASVVPQQVVTASLPLASTVSPYQVVDDDYRLGRGILDDFRPSAYRSSAVVGTSVATTPALVTSTPAVAVKTSNINDFL